MSFPRPRQTAISVSIALAAMAYTSIAPAAQTGSVVSLESVTTLDPSRATPDSDAASFVSADRIEGNPEDQLHLYGNAEIRRAGTVLKGDRITYTQETDEVEAVGNARISRQGASFSGPSMRFKISPRTGDMSDAEYEYAPRNIRGCAKNIRFISGESTVFDDAKVTTCKRDDEAWFIKMNELEIDEYDQTATGTNASLHFMGVPVFGSPWFSFPVSRERRSGFLVPTFGMSSTHGLDLAVPYYFNIAPNYDLTLTPRLMTKRGVMLDTEARFLYNNFETTVDYALMPDDKEMDDSRSSLHVDMSWRRDKLSAFVDYNRVSDDDFISDFSSNVRESSETVLPQEYALRYDETYWNTSINVKKNQALTFDHIDYYKPYERVPQITFNGYNGDFYGFEVGTTIEATRFEHPTFTTGDRFVFEQTVSYPMRGAGWFVVPKGTFLGTWYQLENLDRDGGRFTNKDPHRTTPMFSLDAGLVFDRDAVWFNREAYQTLEPRVYYAYVPYRNQDDLPVFDTTIADLNFATLFSENIFSGYDRVSEANQLTSVLTTRYIDKTSGLKLFKASVGQRNYFSDQRVNFYTPGDTQMRESPLRTDVRSDLLASVGARLTRSITSDVSGQYSSAMSRWVKAKAGVRWQPRPMSLVGLYYRYNYSSERDYTDYQNDYIKQIDLAVQWPITNRLFGLFRYNYSLLQDKPIEMIGGVEYLHDCWTLRFAAQRYTTTSNNDETNFFLQLELNGLGSIGTSPLSELQRNIKGYQTTTRVPDKIGQYDYYE